MEDDNNKKRIIEQVESHKRAICYTFFDSTKESNIIDITILRDIPQKMKAEIKFEQGEKVIYEEAYGVLEQKLGKYLSWLNQNIYIERKFYCKSIISYPECSFLEYIKEKVPKEEIKLQNYYYQYGALVAIIHSLKGNDLLPSRVIQMSDQPVIQDTYQLLQEKPSYNVNMKEYSYFYKKMKLEEVIIKYEKDIRRGYSEFYNFATRNKHDMKEIVKLCFQ